MKRKEFYNRINIFLNDCDVPMGKDKSWFMEYSWGMYIGKKSRAHISNIRDRKRITPIIKAIYKKGKYQEFVDLISNRSIRIPY